MTTFYIKILKSLKPLHLIYGNILLNAFEFLICFLCQWIEVKENTNLSSLTGFSSWFHAASETCSWSLIFLVDTTMFVFEWFFISFYFYFFLLFFCLFFLFSEQLFFLKTFLFIFLLILKSSLVSKHTIYDRIMGHIRKNNNEIFVLLGTSAKRPEFWTTEAKKV